MFEQKDYFNILNGISERVTLLKLMDSLGHVSHDISVFGYWIFDSNSEKALALYQVSFNC